MPPLGHAVLSPSAANRWIHCPPSALANAEAPRTDTVYTLEGTLAHELCELKARREFLGLTELQYDFKHLAIESSELYQDEMERHSDFYIETLKDYISELGDPYVALEKRVDLSSMVPGCFGTADCIIASDDTIHIVDFKYGKGVEVSAIDNTQMKIYALGVLMAYDGMFDQENIILSIVQPRITHEVSSWETTRSSLMQWCNDTVIPAAKQAAAGEGEYCAGTWCKWCVNDGKCRAQLKEFEDLLSDHGEKLPPLLSAAELARAIEIGERLDTWLESVRAHALDMLMKGESVPGFKAVEGRSVRSFKDDHVAFDRARESGIPDEMLYKRTPISLADMEKLIGKKRFGEMMKDIIIKPAGKPTLAPMSDKRDALIPTKSIEDDFKEE